MTGVRPQGRHRREADGPRQVAKHEGAPGRDPADDDGGSHGRALLNRAALQTSRSILALQRRAEADLREAKRTLERQAGELTASLSLLNATLESSPYGIAVFDLARRVVASNARFAAMWKIPPEMLARQDGAELMAHAAAQTFDPAAFCRRCGELRRHPEAESTELVELIDGRTLERQMSPQRLDGRCIGVVVHWRDMTESRQAGQALADSQRRLQALFDNALNGIVLLGDDARCLDANPAACAMLGLARDDLLGRSFFAAASSEAAAPGSRAEEDVAARWVRFLGERRQQGLLRLKRDDAALLEVEYKAVAHILPGVHLWTFSDVTERRLGDQLRIAKEAAEAANQSKSAFLSRMSHELRTPLNAVLGLSEVLRLDEQHPLVARQSQHVDRIHDAGSHLLALIDDILDVSRIEAGSIRVQLENIDAAEVVSDVLRNLRLLADQHAVELSFDATPGAACHVSGDRTRLKQVLLNLVSNAIKYNRRGGRVGVRCEAVRGQVPERMRIHVSDSGLGLNGGQRERLFQPFDRLGRETSDVQGTGIGLVITRNLVELMGGSLEVQSESGVGSTFTVELAAAHLSTELSAVAAATAGGPAKPGPRADVRGTVLYIDDDEVNRLLMQAFLAWRPGVALHLATDGLSGIHEAARCRPDLILIDIRLPDLSGIDVLRAIRAGAAARPAPCVAVSAEAMPEEVERALAAGFDGYLTKPLAAAVLLAEIDRRLGAPRQAAPAA